MPSGCHGSTVPIFDITIPNDPQFLDAVAVLFSVVPVFVGVLIVIGLILRRRITLLLATVLFAVSFLVFEFVVKYAIPSDRPFGSCATTPGMGPAPIVTAFSFLTWGLCEALFHQPQLLRLTKLGYLLAAVTIMAPVPAARWRLKDHSSVQVAVGIVLGVILGMLWFLFLHFVLGRRLDRVFGGGSMLSKVFTLDYFVDREPLLKEPVPDEELSNALSLRRDSQLSIQSTSVQNQNNRDVDNARQGGSPALANDDAPYSPRGEDEAAESTSGRHNVSFQLPTGGDGFGEDLESIGSTSLR